MTTTQGDIYTPLNPQRMITRYQIAVSRHPKIGPLTFRQDVEARNLKYWQRKAKEQHHTTHEHN